MKKQLRKVALSDGVLTFQRKDVTFEDDLVKVKVPKEEAMALKLFQIAMGRSPGPALSAIKLYLETFDGKATARIEDVTQKKRSRKELEDIIRSYDQEE